jgi:hypothetical protein
MQVTGTVYRRYNDAARGGEQGERLRRPPLVEMMDIQEEVEGTGAVAERASECYGASWRLSLTLKDVRKTTFVLLTVSCYEACIYVSGSSER